jgi:hypothetical protein
VTDHPVLPMEAMRHNNDDGFGILPNDDDGTNVTTDDPILQNESNMVDDDDGTNVTRVHPVLPNESQMVNDDDEGTNTETIDVSAMVHVNDDDVDNYVTGMLNDVGLLPAVPELPEFPQFTPIDLRNTWSSAMHEDSPPKTPGPTNMPCETGQHSSYRLVLDVPNNR